MGLFEQEQQSLSQLKSGDRLANICKLAGLEKRNKKDGEPFLMLLLMDQSGKLKGKVWNNVNKFYKILELGEIFKFTGTVTEYKGELDSRISDIEKADPSEYKPEDFIEKADFDTDRMIQDIRMMLGEHLADEKVKRLLDLLFEKYESQFKIHYGAMAIHHAYPGGLLKHTHHILKLAIYIAELYQLDKDILIAGAIFHDIGKMFEFSVAPALQMSAAGGLVGHIVIGNNLLVDLSREIDGFPETRLLQIQHLVLSHHGEKEFGSPEVPKTKEAFALHVIDLLDSKMAIFNELLEKSDPKSLFSEYSHALGKRILVNDRFE